jgi:hypothetical protein
VARACLNGKAFMLLLATKNAPVELSVAWRCWAARWLYAFLVRSSLLHQRFDL